MKLQDRLTKKVKRTRVDKEIDNKLKMKQSQKHGKAREGVQQFRGTLIDSVTAIMNNDKTRKTKVPEEEEKTKDDIAVEDEDTTPLMTISELKEFRDWEKTHEEAQGE